MLSSAASYSSISFSSEKNHFNAYQKFKYPIIANSLQENYQKNQNRIKACTIQNAQFIGNPKFEFLLEGSTYYYCILSDYSIMRFKHIKGYSQKAAEGFGVNKSINKFTSPEKIGTYKVVNTNDGGYKDFPCIFDPNSTSMCGYYEEPTSISYAVEANKLIQYKCFGYGTCDNPIRTVLGSKNPDFKSPKSDSKVTNKSKKTAYYNPDSNSIFAYFLLLKDPFIIKKIILPLIAIYGSIYVLFVVITKIK